MKCLECSGESFVISSTIVVEEIYKINKNGTVSKRPIKKDICLDNAADNDLVVRCVNCETEYIIYDKSRDELLSRTDFNDVDLEDDSEVIDY